MNELNSENVKTDAQAKASPVSPTQRFRMMLVHVKPVQMVALLC